MPRAVVFGEILFDVFPDAECLGGAPLNFGWYLRQFGLDVRMVSAIGKDPRAQKAEQLMQKAGIDLQLVSRRDEPTGYVTVKLSDGEPDFTIHQHVAWDHIELADTQLPQADLLYFGSLAQRTQTNRDTLKRLLANGAGHRLFDVNLRQHYYSPQILRDGLESATLLKCNHEEWNLLKKIAGTDTPADLADRFDIPAIVITMGSGGAELHQHSRSTRARANPGPVVDTVGAGDAVAAVLGAALLKGKDLRSALQVAVDLGSFVVSQRGAQTQLPPELTARC